MMENEFEEYLQLASHELKGPLRKIHTFGELLKKEASQELTKPSLDYLKRLMKNVHVMESLLDDLTSFISFSVGNIAESCNLKKILESAVKDFEPFNPGERARIQFEDLPVVAGNADSLKEVFRSLLSNSIKFRSPVRPLEINISSENLREDEKNKYGLLGRTKYQKVTFADNGVGFTEEQQDIIFRPFIQLNGKSTSGGNGLGLALCKKIIEAHNGIIYASGNQSGCCITLILPLSDQ